MNWRRLISLGLIFISGGRSISATQLTNAPVQPLTQSAYIWQRAWNAPLREAIQQHGPRFASLVALNAEVSWKQGRPQVVRMPLDYAGLKAAKTPVGLALRIGPYAGPFRNDDPVAHFLLNVTRSLMAGAQTNQLDVKELQIDFDCAESKLAGYRIWVAAIRKQVAPVPVIITTLPSWLNQDSFLELIKAADGYVLQVHSLERPKGVNAPFSLCDPTSAKLTVERAGKLGVPFRVALPTYGYLTAFSATGAFIGLSAEGPSRNWPKGVQLRDVRSDAKEIAGLVNTWKTKRPDTLEGIIWYRLPISLDVLNWSWPTLEAVMAGRSPRESLRVEMSKPDPGLVEISLVNDGEADLSSRLVIEIGWQNARLVASDGLRDFTAVDSGSNTMQFRARTDMSAVRLLPGERQPVGWLRLNQEVEVQIETKEF